MVKNKLLMIAYHYPPLKGSSGIQRTLKFSQYLTQLGWRISIISAHPRAYPQTSQEQMAEIPAGVTVRRAFAFDTARHLSIAGRYPGWLALPDRWVSWCVGILFDGLREIRRNRPEVIWSTFPVASAHLGAYLLHRITGIPWVADFRDSMTEDNYPPDGLIRRVYRWVEAKVVKHAARVVFTTPGALRMYAERYPEQPANKWKIISNGYDEENFQSASILSAQRHDEMLTLVHSGLLYPSERNPIPFFDALTELKQTGAIADGQLRIILRASGHDDYFRPLIDQRGLQAIVKLEASVPYQQALQEMLSADALLLLQAKNCNHQIPAKLYEYLRARRPVFALTDHAGDTAAVLREAGIDTIALLDDKDDIKVTFSGFLQQLQDRKAPVASEASVQAYSRQSLTRLLSDLLREI